MIKIHQILVIDDTDNTINTLVFNWTKRQPKETGFYYYKYPNSNNITIIDVNIQDTTDSTKPRFCYFLGNSLRYDILDLPGTFYGPLPKP